MGSFQSKKKYDVATGESTIKGKNQASRNDRKREHLSRISQHNETLNKLNSQQSEVVQIVNGSVEESEIKVIKLQAEQINFDPDTKLHENANANRVTSDDDDDDKEVPNINEELVTHSSEFISVEQSDEENLQENIPNNEQRCLGTVDTTKSLEEVKPEAACTIEDSAIQEVNDVVCENQDIVNSHSNQKVKDEAVSENQDETVTEEANETIYESKVPETQPEEPCKNQSDIVETLQEDTCANKMSYINEAFINEERKSVLDSVTIEPKVSELVRCDDNEQDAITALNDVIQEEEATANHKPDNQEEAVCDINKTNSSVEHSRKRGMIGDPPTKEEISGSEKTEVVEELQNESQNVTNASEAQYGKKKEESFVSHIYLENVNSDDVHYTLDKLQLMEEQIHSTRARIMSIKEID